MELDNLEIRIKKVIREGQHCPLQLKKTNGLGYHYQVCLTTSDIECKFRGDLVRDDTFAVNYFACNYIVSMGKDKNERR